MATGLHKAMLKISVDVGTTPEEFRALELTVGDLAEIPWHFVDRCRVDPVFTRRCRRAMRQLEFELDGDRLRQVARTAEIRRALYRLGFPTPYGRKIGDWLAVDPPDWKFQ